jgi:hypothetical protein
MTAVAGDDQDAPDTPSPDRGRRVLATGEYSRSESENRPSCTQGDWHVRVQVRARMVSRQVCHQGSPWSPAEKSGGADNRHSGEMIWPTWPATLQEEMDASASPLSDLQAHWEAATNRLRDSAKWMAAVLGAALAAIIPTAPHADLSRDISLRSAILGISGLACVSITMLLVLRVMQPQSVSYDQIQLAKPPAGRLGKLHERARSGSRLRQILESPLYQWKQDIQQHPDLYLPCGVESLPALRKLMVVEEITLVALALAEEDADGESTSKLLRKARAARAARLHELRTAAASIVALGVYHQVRARSTCATYLGVALGLIGVVAIIVAVA